MHTCLQVLTSLLYSYNYHRHTLFWTSLSSEAEHTFLYFLYNVKRLVCPQTMTYTLFGRLKYCQLVGRLKYCQRRDILFDHHFEQTEYQIKCIKIQK